MRYAVALPLMACHVCGRNFTLSEWRALPRVAPDVRSCPCRTNIPEPPPDVELEQAWLSEEEYRRIYPHSPARVVAIPESPRDRFELWCGEQLARVWDWLGERFA